MSCVFINFNKIFYLYISYIHFIKNKKEEFEDTKGVIRIRKSKKNRQDNGQKKKDK